MSYGGVALRFGCDRAELGDLGDRFVPLGLDDDVRSSLDALLATRHGRMKTVLHGALRPLMSDFDINGLLGMYRMHLATTAQWRRLLGEHARGRLLDVGAGAGDVTSTLAPLFDAVVATETSRAMVWRLARRGFRAVLRDVTVEEISDGPFDVVACLNVLDRCSRPLTLLERCGDALATDGRLVVALALPYTPFVYRGGATVDPDETLAVRSRRWEAATRDLADAVDALGFEATACTRLAYVSAGDSRKPAYVLDDAVLVLRRR